MSVRLSVGISSHQQPGICSSVRGAIQHTRAGNTLCALLQVPPAVDDQRTVNNQDLLPGPPAVCSLQRQYRIVCRGGRLASGLSWAKPVRGAKDSQVQQKRECFCSCCLHVVERGYVSVYCLLASHNYGQKCGLKEAIVVKFIDLARGSASQLKGIDGLSIHELKYFIYVLYVE